MLYAGTKNGNLEISTNGGATWTAATVPYPVTGLSNVPVTGVFVSGNTIYVTTGGELEDSHYYSEVEKSTDAGRNWVNITPAGFVASGAFPSWPPNTGVNYYGVFMSPFIVGDTLYAETSTGYNYISTDGGATWGDPNFDRSAQYGFGIGQLYIQAGTPNTLYASGDGFTYVSHDNGQTWSFNTITSPDDATAHGIFLNGNYLYSSNSIGNLAYYDITAGSSGSWINTLQQPGGDMPYGLSIASDGTMYVGGVNTTVLTSSDNGLTWYSIGGGSGSAEVYSTTVHDDTLYAGDNSGAVFSYSSGAWNTLGSTGGAVLGLATVEPTLYAGLLTITNSVVQWNGTSFPSVGTFPSGLRGVSSLAAIAGPTLYVGTVSGSVEKWNGTAWSGLTPPDGSQVNGLAIDSSYPNVLYAGTQNGHIEISTNGGSTLIKTPSDPDPNGYPVLSLVARYH